MSIKLNSAMRATVAKEMLKHRFAGEVEKLWTARAAFAASIYEDIFPKKMRAEMDALPDGWLPTTECVAVKFGASFERLYFNGRTYDALDRLLPKEVLDRKISFRMPAKREGGTAKVYDALHRLSVRAEKQDQDHKNLTARVATTTAQIEAALNSASTVKRLTEMWPEAGPFLAKYSPKLISVPAIPVEALNKLLDLPVTA